MHNLFKEVTIAQHELERLRLIEQCYEALCRAECRRQGIPPDDEIAGGGHMAWQLVGYEAARKETNDAEE